MAGSRTTDIAQVNVDGFDFYTSTSEFLEVFSGSGAIWQNSGGRFGAACAKIDTAGVRIFLRLNPNIAPGATGSHVVSGEAVFGSSYFKLDALPGSTLPLLQFDGGAGSYGVSITSTGAIQTTTHNGSAIFTSAAATISPGVWYNIGLRFRVAANGFFTTVLDGTVIHSATYTSTGLSAIASRLYGLALYPVSPTGYTWFDDAAIGGSHNHTPSEGLEHCRFVPVVPTGTGSLDIFVPVTGSDPDYTYINELYPNPATELVAAGGGSGTFTIATTTWGTAASVEVVVVSAYGQSGGDRFVHVAGAGLSDSGTSATTDYSLPSGDNRWRRSTRGDTPGNIHLITEIGVFSGAAQTLTALNAYIVCSVAGTVGTTLTAPALSLPTTVGNFTVTKVGDLTAPGLHLPATFGSHLVQDDQAIAVSGLPVPVIFGPALTIQPDRIAPLGLYLPLAFGATVVYNPTAGGGNTPVVVVKK